MYIVRWALAGMTPRLRGDQIDEIPLASQVPVTNNEQCAVPLEH